MRCWGKVNPSGKLNETWPLQLEDTPACAYFPSKERTAEYREGLYIGYRYYDTANIPVRYPFGHGLSYTTFLYSDIRAEKDRVTFTIANVGAWDGAEVAQVYVSCKDGNVFRPQKELKGFAKVFLKAGESRTVSVSLDDKAFRYFNVKTNRWEVESGIYTISVASDAAHVRLSANIRVEGTNAPAPYGVLPGYESGRITRISEEEYRDVLGHPIPDGHWGGELTRNDAICQLSAASHTDVHHVKPIKPLPSRKSDKQVPWMDCFTAPCQGGCPIHQDIPEYMELCRKGLYAPALKLITEKNPLPFLTGTICAHRCQTKCSRNFYDESVRIRDTKLLAAEKGYNALMASIRPTEKVSGKKAAIIGGGPTGIAAAYFLARAGIETTIFERESCLGGVPRHVIPSFRIANETIEKDIALMEKYGVDVRCGAPAPSVTELKAMGYTHILFAVGAWKPGKLEIAGDVAGAIQWMKGVKAGNIAVGGSIAVVGGGNTAMDAARLAKRSGAKQVTLVYRRTRKYMPADEHELALALQDGVTFAELAAPVKQADGVLKCEKMVLGEADASGRRSPVGSGEFFDIPCDLVISAVGEQVDSALMAANGIEVDKKGRPAFQTNLPGVYAAGDATRGPATVVEGIADAARFAQEVIGQAYAYDIPQQAYITKTDAQAKKGILNMSGCVCQEGSRCLQCSTVCENCVDSCPNRANVAIAMADGSHQILHVDKMCNECGNCTQFCPYASEPCHDKFTLFQTAEDMEDSHNAGVLFLEDGKVRVRLAGAPQEYNLDEANDLPRELETFILTIRDQYGYLFA